MELVLWGSDLTYELRIKKLIGFPYTTAIYFTHAETGKGWHRNKPTWGKPTWGKPTWGKPTWVLADSEYGRHWPTLGHTLQAVVKAGIKIS